MSSHGMPDTDQRNRKLTSKNKWIVINFRIELELIFMVLSYLLSKISTYIPKQNFHRRNVWNIRNFIGFL